MVNRFDRLGNGLAMISFSDMVTESVGLRPGVNFFSPGPGKEPKFKDSQTRELNYELRLPTSKLLTKGFLS